MSHPSVVDSSHPVALGPLGDETIDAYRALRSGAILLDRSDCRQMTAVGPEAIEWLQRMVSNDVAALQPGEGCYATLLNAQGRMVSDLRVYHRCGDTDDDTAALLIVVDSSAAQAAFAHLDHHLIMEDVAFELRPEGPRRLELHGPASAEILEPRRRYSHREQAIGGVTCLVVGSEELGETGFEIYVDDDAAFDAVKAALEGKGARYLTSDAALEAPAIAAMEAFSPRWGVELSEETIPYEARLFHGLALAKGCYIGQETIARLDARGRSKHTLAAFTLPEGAAVPEVGAPVKVGERTVGTLASTCWSPKHGAPLVMGTVLSMALREGADPTIDGHGVVALALPTAD